MRKKHFHKQVAVFGGAGNMGKLTVKLFCDLGYKVISVDPKSPKSISAAEAIKKSQIIFFSVSPISQIKVIIKKNLKLFKDHIILDNATIKQPLLEVYKTLNSKGASICSVNPLCKHDQPLIGQKVLLLEFGKNARKARAIAESLYKNAGMKTIPFAFKDHDQTMLFIQFIPHLVMRAVGRVFEKSSVDMNKIEEIASANFQLFNLSLWRTLVQDPHISSTIIHGSLEQPKSKKLVKEMKSILDELVEQINEKELSALLKKSYIKLNKKNIGRKMNKVTTNVLKQLAKEQSLA